MSPTGLLGGDGNEQWGSGHTYNTISLLEGYGIKASLSGIIQSGSIGAITLFELMKVVVISRIPKDRN